MASRAKFVTQAECRTAMTNVGADVAMVKLAMVGADLRGGMVKDIAALNAKVDNLIAVRQCAGEISQRWKLAIFSAVVASALSLLGIAVKLAGA